MLLSMLKAAWKAELQLHSDVACLLLAKCHCSTKAVLKLYFRSHANELRKMFEKPKLYRSTIWSLNKDFVDFVRNFNMHCVGKTVSDLHALLIDYEKGLKDKAPTPQILDIQKGMVNMPKPQANKKGKGKAQLGTALFYLARVGHNTKNKKVEHGAVLQSGKEAILWRAISACGKKP
ncbi:hypothetical protein Tco_0054561 [Tanacetum coccineum]